MYLCSVPKRLEICLAGLGFESEHAHLVKMWDNRDFTRLTRACKECLKEGGVYLNPKKKVSMFSIFNVVHSELMPYMHVIKYFLAWNSYTCVYCNKASIAGQVG